MEKLLDKGWRMRRVGADSWLPATVPGSVYGDLLLGGQMEDPFYRTNEDAALKLMDFDYEYNLRFDADADLLSCEDVRLKFDGLDTLADIVLNGEEVGSVDNMHRIWEFSVLDLLQPKDNDLQIIFHSPTKFFEEYNKQYPLPGSTDCMAGYQGLRKAHCMSGWDWGPRLPDAGIWRPVYLIGLNDARLENVLITQQHSKDEEGETQVSLGFRVDFATLEDDYVQRFYEDAVAEEYTYKVEVTDPDGKLVAVEENPIELEIPSPRLWWPNGLGDQPLYTVKVSLFHEEELLDTLERRIGLRTLTIKREKDDHGESFAPTVNGISFFAMGADYIPEDNLLGRVTPERTRKLLSDCAESNFNFIRVWGGGYYPDDWFFDACDELGLCVWQDFMFACALYELTPEFEENIRAEFIDNIRRLRDHASLALWCGNNEIESSTTWWDFTMHSRSHYIQLFEYILPSVLREEDPDRMYWPSSPSSAGGFDNTGDENRGDCHYWDVWHGNKPFTDYRSHNFRFLSEFGFQSFPELASVKRFTLPEDRNIFSYVMEKHQRNGSANGKLMTYLEQTYLMPGNFETLLYATQLMQADAIRYGVEHFRRIRGICMGTLYWQLNDCWPVASWASIDYYGQWKALQYSAKRFFAPILISCAEEGTLTQNANVNAQPFELEKSIHLNVSNETLKDELVTVTYALRDATGEIIDEHTLDVEVPALSSVWLEKKEYPEANIYENYVSYEASIDGEVVSEGTVLFVAPKFFHFKNPNLSLTVNGNQVTITSDTYAKCVEVYDENEIFRLSDNDFDMNPGSKTITLLEGDPDELQLKVRSVFDIR